MSGPPPIRALEAADADTFAALVREAFAGLAVDPAPSASRLSGDDVRMHLTAGGGGLTTKPTQAGLLWSERNGELYLSRLAVHPGYRHQGLARGLLGAAEALALQRSLTRLTLSTRLALAGNRALFASCGFVEGLRHSHPGHREPTSVDMAKYVGWNRDRPGAVPLPEPDQGTTMPNLLKIVAAALVAGSLSLAATAQAQPYHGRHVVVVHHYHHYVPHHRTVIVEHR